MDPSSQQLMSGSLPHTEGLKLGDGGSEAMILALPGARSSIAGSIPSAAHSARDPLLLRPPSAVPGLHSLLRGNASLRIRCLCGSRECCRQPCWSCPGLALTMGPVALKIPTAMWKA